MLRTITFTLAVALAATVAGFAQDSKDKDKDSTFDVRSSVGDLHVGKDADARKAGLPLYPGARPKVDEKNDSQANLSLLTDAFGIKLVVANYESDDDPAKVLDFYRDKLKKYGKVLECHTEKHGGDVDVNDNDDNKKTGDAKKSKELQCDGSKGPVTELKAGTEDNQHVVAVEPRHDSKGSTFALVYVRTHGKQGEI
jgi:hypothetical protein